MQFYAIAITKRDLCQTNMKRNKLHIHVHVRKQRIWQDAPAMHGEHSSR